MEAKLGDAYGREPARGLHDLLDGHAKLGVLRLADDAVGGREVAAGVHAQADHGGQLSVQRA